MTPAQIRPPEREAVYQLIDGEVEYAAHWDKQRKAAGKPTRDDYATVESWICWMEEYVAKARAAATQSIDKTEALASIRKVAGLAVNCMTHNETPARDPEAKRKERAQKDLIRELTRPRPRTIGETSP